MHFKSILGFVFKHCLSLYSVTLLKFFINVTASPPHPPPPPPDKRWSQWSECSNTTQTTSRTDSMNDTETKPCFPKFHATFTLPIGPDGPEYGYGYPKFALAKTLDEALDMGYVQISNCSDSSQE